MAGVFSVNLTSIKNGCEVIANTVQRTARHIKQIKVNSDCVIASLTLSSSRGDNAAYVSTLGIAGLIIKQGNSIPIPKGYYISKITLTSGSVIAYS